jgi:hypothetical protein
MDSVLGQRTGLGAGAKFKASFIFHCKLIYSFYIDLVHPVGRLLCEVGER